MAYDHQRVMPQILVASSIAASADIAASRFYVGGQPVNIRALWATIIIVTAAAVSTATYKYRPTPASDTGSSTIGTLVIPTGLVAGRHLYKFLATSFKALPGSEIILSLVGAATGTATFGFDAEIQWDTPQNNAAAIAST